MGLHGKLMSRALSLCGRIMFEGNPQVYGRTQTILNQTTQRILKTLSTILRFTMQLGVMTHPTMVFRTTCSSGLAELCVAPVLPSSRVPVITPIAVVPCTAKLFALPLAHGHPLTTLVRMLTRAATEKNGAVCFIHLLLHLVVFPFSSTAFTFRLAPFGRYILVLESQSFGMLQDTPLVQHKDVLVLVPTFGKFLGRQKQRHAPRYLVLWPACQFNGPRPEQLFNLGHPVYHRVFLVSCGQPRHTVFQRCEVRRHFSPVAEVYFFTRKRNLKRPTDRPSVRQDLTLAEKTPE